MVPGFGFRWTHHVLVAAGIHQVFCHEDDENRLHSIKAKALGRFVPNDVGNASRQGPRGPRCGKIPWGSHEL